MSSRHQAFLVLPLRGQLLSPKFLTDRLGSFVLSCALGL